MCYSVYGMKYIKEPLLLIGKSRPCGDSGLPLSLSEWSFIKCLKEGRKEMFYLTTHSTHFIYGYMASDTSRGALAGTRNSSVGPP